MKKILVAGATGYLGRNVIKALRDRGYWIRALGRSEARLDPIKEFANELFIGEVTDFDSLDGLCDDIDVVFSSVGITRQKDGLTYQDVDYQGNRNLLTIAEASGVSKFMYVHVLNAEKLQHVAMIQAKQAFVDELKRSALEHSVICPSGFFSDMEEILSMARAGRVYLFGDGSNRINPIHGADLAEVCVDALESRAQQLDVGGPEIFTYREIAEIAFEALEKPARITCLPKPLIAAIVQVLRWVTPVRAYGPIQFLSTIMTMDTVGETYGRRNLLEHFRRCANAESPNATDETRPSPRMTKHHS